MLLVFLIQLYYTIAKFMFLAKLDLDQTRSAPHFHRLLRALDVHIIKLFIQYYTVST